MSVITREAASAADLLLDVTSGALREIVAAGSYRTFLASDNLVDAPGRAEFGETEIAVWCSNDYLGLSQHPAVVDAAIEHLRAHGVGSGGSRNISGTSPLHQQVESRLARWHGKDAGLLFSSGYVANVETLTTLRRAMPDLVVYSDRLNHRSLIEGIRGHGETRIFEHNDVGHLRRLLEETDPGRPKLIVLESIYSMDADCGPLREVCDLAEELGAMTYVDETHAVGMRGPQGAGLLAELGEIRATFVQAVAGKALGSVGGYVVGPRPAIDYLRSTAPGFIFTTALPPALLAAWDTALTLVQGEVGADLREGVRTNVGYLKQLLRQRDIAFLDDESHFVPVLVPGAARVKAVARTLLSAHRIYVQPINAPSVPAGTERIRLAPGPLRSSAEIAAFVAALDSALRLHPPVEGRAVLTEGIHS